MRTTIDTAGRMVIPKAMRDELGIGAGGEVEVECHDQQITIEVPGASKRVIERDGRVVIVPDEPTAALTDDTVRRTLDDVRR